MAFGLLGTAYISTPATNTTVFLMTLGANQAFSINFCNQNATPVRIRFAIATTATPASSEWLEYDKEILGNDSFERGGMTSSTALYIVAQSDTAGVSIQVYGV
jgi:hypothetical protein